MPRGTAGNGATDGFTCSRCGQIHEGPPLAYDADYPDAWAEVPESQRRKRVVMSAEQCIIDKREFFVRARIVIPVVDGPGPLEWGVWASLSKQSFLRMADQWSTPGREREPPCSGQLQTALPGYAATLGLKATVHTQPLGERPTLELEALEHPLAREQRGGITTQRVREIAEQLLHPQT